MKNYLEIFKDAFNHGASDDELEAIIDEAANEIENDIEYSDFYEAVTNIIKNR